MSKRTVILVGGIAAAAGAAIVGLVGERSLQAKVPGPCEVRQQVSYPGTDIPPPPVQRTVHRYDAKGQLVLVQQMLDATEVEETVRHEYDAAGNATLQERIRHQPTHVQHSDGTKTIEAEQISWIRWTYDDAGRMLTRVYERGGQDALLPHETVYAYDAQGHKTGAHAQWEGKYSSDTVYEVDDRGQVLAERHQGGRIGSKSYAYDEGGRVLREAEDATGDGVANRIITRTYDDAGLLQRELETLRSNGNTAEGREITWTYDDVGNPLQRREAQVASPDGGSLEVIDTYGYACWTIRDGVPVDQRGAP